MRCMFPILLPVKTGLIRQKDLKEAIVSNLNEEERKLFEENVGVSESVIMCTGTGAPDPNKVTNEMDTWVQNMRYLPIDRISYQGEIPQWDYVEFVTDFGDHKTENLYEQYKCCDSSISESWRGWPMYS